VDLGPAPGSDGSEARHTTHLSVIDANGDAVALTTTLNGSFGSAVVVTGAGFLLNNEMDDFATRPGSPNTYGLVQGEANAIAPGKRMLSSMTPAIVRDERGRVLLVAGAAGGPRIISTTFGILSAVLDHGADVEAAVTARRSHHQHLPDEILIESGAGADEATLAALKSFGHALKRVEAIADASTIGRDPADPARWLGVAEPRAQGAAAGVR
jgi:gamma-glutamyltranspeptidase/glutathione hydrolase